MTRRKTIPALPNLPDVADLGPAMSALTPLERGFVIAKVYYGLDNSNACRAAGYAESTATDRAYEISHREDVQAAILEVGKALLRGEGARSILTMVKIRDDERVRPDVRLRAAEMIANRSGFHVSTEHHEHFHHHVSEAEMDRRILALAAELGMSPEDSRKMLIAPADMQKNAEGVFEIAPVEPREPSTDPRQVAKRATRQRRAGMTPEEIEADKQRIQAERSEQMRRERAEHEAARAGDELTPEPDLW
jgi:hypothetical protein